jgi:hypothetical protein
VSLFSMEVTSLHHIPNHWVSRWKLCIILDKWLWSL